MTQVEEIQTLSRVAQMQADARELAGRVRQIQSKLEALKVRTNIHPDALDEEEDRIFRALMDANRNTNTLVTLLDAVLKGA
jgi:hypothetical protein